MWYNIVKQESMPVIGFSGFLKINMFFCNKEHESLIVCSHMGNGTFKENCSDHKMQAKPTRAGNFWKVLESWKGNSLQLPHLREKRHFHSVLEPELKSKLKSMQHQCVHQASHTHKGCV